MKDLLLLFALLSVGAIAVGQPKKDEPKAAYTITINGIDYNISENEELKIDSTLVRPTISIKMLDRKKFSSGLVSFDYPSKLTYEHQQDFAYNSWTFSGNSLVIMYFELDVKAPLKDFAEELVQKFGKQNSKSSPARKEIGGRSWNGQRIDVSLAGEKLTLEIYEIKLADFKTRFIAFQDSLGENGAASEEKSNALKMVDKSFKYE